MRNILSPLRRELANLDTVSRIAILAGVWIVFSILDPAFASWDSAFSVLQGFAFVGLVAIGVGVAMIAGELDLSVASVAAVAAILAVKLIDLGLVPAVLLAAAITTVFGAVQGWCIARLQINSIVFTIGTLFALRGVAHLMTDSQSVLLPVDRLGASDTLIERIGVLSPFSLVTIAVVVVLGVGLAVSRWGRMIYAVGGARSEATAAGVPQRPPIILAFAISGFTAGLAGALSGIAAGSGSALAYSNLLLLAVTAVLIGGIGLYGGRGTMLNIILGVLILQSFVAGLTNENASQDVQQLATGGLLLAVIVVEFVFDRGDGSRLGRLFRRRSSRSVPAERPAG